MSPPSRFWEENSPSGALTIIPDNPTSQFQFQCRLAKHGTVATGLGAWPQVDECDLLLGILKTTAVEQTISVAEQGVKWKKAEFRKEERSQTIEAKTPSCPGGVHFELILEPSYGFPAAGLCRVSASQSVFTWAALSAIFVHLQVKEYRLIHLVVYTWNI